MLTQSESDTLTGLQSIVGRFMAIDSVTQGSSKGPELVHYTGRLLREDTDVLYDELTAALKPHQVTPLFRWDETSQPRRHVVSLIPGLPEPRPSNPLINLALLVITLLSVLVTGALYSYEGPVDPANPWPTLLANLDSGLPFMLSMMGILLAHEFGHYIAGRLHGTAVSLPYFIPLPLISPLGTMGAVINMKEIPKNRRVLVDIGVAGPLAGLVVTIPVLLLGLSLSELNPIPAVIPAGGALQMEGNSLLYLLSKWAVFGQLLPAPASYGAGGPLLYWLGYFFTGRPLPLGAMDVMLHPVAFAGWAGLLITALNLIPAGQLDGGHMLYVLVGRDRARRVLPFILVATIALGFLYNGWWLWTALIFFLSRAGFAEPLDQITQLDGRRKFLAALALFIFILIFSPVPLILLQ